MSHLLVGNKQTIGEAIESLRLSPNEKGALDVIVYPNGSVPDLSSYLVFRTKADQDEIKSHLERFRTKSLKVTKDLFWMRVDISVQELLAVLEQIPRVVVMF